METIDDITINYEEDGHLKVKELNKEVLTKGAWTTIMFTYQEWSNKDEDYGPVKASIRRYQKYQGSYRQKSKFNITNGKQARQIIKILDAWFPEEDE